MSTQQSGRMTRARMRRFLTRAKALAKRFKNAALSMRTLVCRMRHRGDAGGFLRRDHARPL